MDFQPGDLDNTEADAIGMAYSVALKTLSEIMVDPNAETQEKRWSAEAILRHEEEMTEATKETTNTKEVTE